MAKNIQDNVTEMHLNNNLPTMLIDSMNITARKDDFVLIRFLSSLPEGLNEQSRFMIQKGTLKKMMDVIANEIGYFPAKKKSKKK